MNMMMSRMKRNLLLFAFTLAAFFVLSGVDAKAAMKVTDFKQTQASKDSVSFQATADKGEDSFFGAILYSDKNCTKEVSRTGYTECTFTFNSLNPGTNYWVKFGHGNTNTKDGCFDDLSEEAFEVVTAPGPVKNVKFVGATEKTVTLQWDPAPGADMYIVLSNKAESTYAQTNRCDFTLNGATAAYVIPIKTFSDGKTFARGTYEYIRNLSCLSSKVEDSFFGLVGKSGNTLRLSVGGGTLPVYGQYYEIEGKPVKGKGKKIALNNTLGSTGSATISSNTMYKYRARVYIVLSDGSKKYSNWSNYRYIISTSGGQTISNQAGKISVKWKKLKGTDRVVIKMATSQDGKYKKVATVKAGAKKAEIRKFGKKALVPGKSYYIHIEYQTKVKGKYKTSDVISQSGRLWCR